MPGVSIALFPQWIGSDGGAGNSSWRSKPFKYAESGGGRDFDWWAARRTKALPIILLAMITFAACSHLPLPGTGDPGNARLNALAGIRSSMFPENSTLTRPVQKVPAEWDSGYGSWNGPDVEVDFSSGGTLADVFSYYDRFAPTHGWIAAPGRAELGYATLWHKTLPDGVVADLRLFDDGSPLSSSSQQAPSYGIVGSVSAKL